MGLPPAARGAVARGGGRSQALRGADREEGGGELGEDGAGGFRGVEVEVAELGHEGFEEGAAAVLEELGANGEVGGDRLVAEAPGGHLGDEGDELDCGLGEAVGRLLLVVGVGRAGDEADGHAGA